MHRERLRAAEGPRVGKGDEVTHHYYPRDMQTAPTVEEITTDCPFCKGSSTEYLGADESNSDYSNYVCYDCEIKFKIYEPIPY